MWEHVLGRTGLGADDDFFAIGGTSLHALEMIVRVSDRFGRTVPEALAFRNRTIASLATAIAALDDDGADSRHAIEPLAHDERPPSAGEEAMAYEWRRDPDDRRYNVGRLYRLPPDYDSDRLDDAIRAVVAHQPTLHTAYDAARTVLPVHRAVSFERIDHRDIPEHLVAIAHHQGDLA